MMTMNNKFIYACVCCFYLVQIEFDCVGICAVWCGMDVRDFTRCVRANGVHRRNDLASKHI